MYYRLELAPVSLAADGTIPVDYAYSSQMRPARDAGFDLVATEDFLPTAVARLLPLGTRARLIKCYEDAYGSEEDVHFWLVPRSSIFKTGYIMANSVGVIDASYRGELKAPLICPHPENCQPIMRGTRLFQIVAPDMGWIREVRIVNQLPETMRGDGGFGSTGL